LFLPQLDSLNKFLVDVTAVAAHFLNIGLESLLLIPNLLLDA
jgi:hypothetical protein